jgi:hypothetical protein
MIGYIKWIRGINVKSETTVTGKRAVVPCVIVEDLTELANRNGKNSTEKIALINGIIYTDT